MESINTYIKNKMKIGVIGISGKGKSTFLNHLIDENIAEELSELIGPKFKEQKESGQTKNPVRYHINTHANVYRCRVSRSKDGKFVEKELALNEVAKEATSTDKCTVTIEARPSTEFSKVMADNGLTELEFIDTQGLLDSLDGEAIVPYEIKECALLLYLYDSSDLGNRKDHIAKYRSFLNSISDKPLVFLETNTQWQMLKAQVESSIEHADEQLRELDSEFSIPENAIRTRYEELTGKSEYRSNETFILSSVLGASDSSVNFYKVKLPVDLEEEYFDQCLRICSAHAMLRVFGRLKGIKQSLEIEFQKAKGGFQYSRGFDSCYGLLYDVFVYQYQRIDYNSSSHVLLYARRDHNRFKEALKAFQNGGLFDVNLEKITKEIHTEYGYHYVYETYKNQKIVDCMQLLLDLYRAYLRKVKVTGNNNLTKAFQVHLEKSITSDYMCRDTGYDIPILDEETFLYCMNELQKWSANIPINRIIYKEYDKFDVSYMEKDRIIRMTQNVVGSVPSLITKLVYSCMAIDSKMYNTAIETLTKNTTNNILANENSN